MRWPVVLWSLAVILTATAGNYALLFIAVVGFIIAAPPQTPKPPRVAPRPPERPATPSDAFRALQRERESWIEAVRVEYLAGDLTVGRFEAEVWAYLILYDEAWETVKRLNTITLEERTVTYEDEDGMHTERTWG